MLVISGVAIVLVVAVGCDSSTAGTHLSGSSTSVSTPPASSAPETSTTSTDSTKPTKHHRHTKQHRHSLHPPGVPAVDLPKPSLTPGAAFHVGRHTICKAGYSARVRDVPEQEATAVYSRYHTVHTAYAHEVDHLVSLEIGGSNAITNLWPEPYAGRWGARTKDILENKLHDLVCNGRLTLKKAQHQEAANWVAAYHLYISRSLPKPPRHGGRPSTHHAKRKSRGAGGFWASTYGSADTIYCADDPEWHQLSKTYLHHFPTYKKAREALPGYHLHQPC